MIAEELKEGTSYLIKTKNDGMLEEFNVLSNTGTFVKFKKLDGSEFWIEGKEFSDFYQIIEKVQNKNQQHLNS